MKVVVITGSAHKKGTSAYLADELIRGTKEQGNEVYRFDSAFEDVKGCLGCGHCRKTGNPCVRQDAMEKLIPHLQSADVIVFATPVYYFGMSSQIKTVIDRFFAPEESLKGNKKTVLLATAASPVDTIIKNVTGLFHDVAGWMQWENAGEVLAIGCGSREQMESTDYPAQAYEIGKAL